jgi:hypothetical protein
VAVLCALGFGGWRYEHARSLEHRLGVVASQIAHRPVKVHCQGSVAATVDVGGELGKVQFDGTGKPADTTDLIHSVCGWLAKLPGGTVANAATAVAVLTHESYHLAGVTDEAQTQCYALQTMGWTAIQFGATPPQARTWTAFSLARYPDMPDEYVSGDCRNGGPWDLHPTSDIWP